MAQTPTRRLWLLLAPLVVAACSGATQVALPEIDANHSNVDAGSSTDAHT